MTFATLTSKGQTTIPLGVRTAAKLKAGDRIHFTVLADGTIILRVKSRCPARHLNLGSRLLGLVVRVNPVTGTWKYIPWASQTVNHRW